MRRLRIIGEGHRDEVCLPPILERLLGSTICGDFKSWGRFRLHTSERGGRGLNQHGRKLLFAITEAREQQMLGVVAVADHDKGREDRLQDMQNARGTDRERNPPLPVAFGLPKPHIEAWLLDDAVAVREGLGLSKGHRVPNVAKAKSPKAALSTLYDKAPVSQDGVREVDVLPEIARRLDLKRCPHKKATGLQAFADELSKEIAPALASA